MALQGHQNLIIYILIFIHSVMYLNHFLAFERNEIGGTHLVLSKHGIYRFHI